MRIIRNAEEGKQPLFAPRSINEKSLDLRENHSHVWAGNSAPMKVAADHSRCCAKDGDNARPLPNNSKVDGALSANLRVEQGGDRRGVHNGSLRSGRA